MTWLEWIGKRIIFFLSQIGEAMVLLWRTIRQVPKLNWKLTIEQMAHLGVNSLPILSLTMFFAGAVMTLQMADVLIRYGAQGTVGGIMAIAMGRELGPVLAGVVLAGRVGAAITAELGTMKVTEQIDALRVMAVNPIGYLVGMAGMTYTDSIQIFSTLSDLTYGLIKSCVFGAVIALVGSYKGMYTNMGATAVGYATTSSVVTSIILVFVLNYFLSALLF